MSDASLTSDVSSSTSDLSSASNDRWYFGEVYAPEIHVTYSHPASLYVGQYRASYLDLRRQFTLKYEKSKWTVCNDIPGKTFPLRRECYIKFERPRYISMSSIHIRGFVNIESRTIVRSWRRWCRQWFDGIWYDTPEDKELENLYDCHWEDIFDLRYLFGEVSDAE